MRLVDGRLRSALDENLVDADMRRACSHPHHGLSNIFSHQRVQALVDLVLFGLISLEANHAKFCFRQSRI